jgi:hypothetical protein
LFLKSNILGGEHGHRFIDIIGLLIARLMKIMIVAAIIARPIRVV